MKSILILLLWIFNLAYSQKDIIQLRSKYNSLEKFLVATYEGGVTFPFSDFQTPAIGYAGRFGFEYYFPSKSITIGLRFFGMYGELKGESNTGRNSGDGLLQRNIKKFNTPFVLLEPSIAIALGKKLFIPYLAFGADYVLAFIPLETSSYSLYTNSKRNPFLTYSGEFGIRYFLSNNLSVNFAAKYFIGTTDELDGFVSRKKDSFVTVTTGLSIHLFSKQRIR